MKSGYVLFAVTLLLSSLAVHSSDVNSLIFSYLGENETFSKVPFNLSDGQYYIVSINEPTFIIHSLPSGKMEIVSDRDGIKNALIGYYALQGISSEDLKLNSSYSQELLSLINSFNSSRKSEAACKTYIGIDRFNCTDLDSCWRACYTPICQQFKVGAGRPFLELIWGFSNLSAGIDSNYSSFVEELSSTSEWKSREQIDRLIGYIDNMKNDSLLIANSDLFNPMAIGFCLVLDSDVSYLVEARIKLLTREGRIAPLISLDDTVDRMLNNTLFRTSGAAKKQHCSSIISKNMAQLSSIKSDLSDLKTTAMKRKLAELESIAGVGGCENMSESQIYQAEDNFANLSKNVAEYGTELGEVLSEMDGVNSSLSGMQGDLMMQFKLPAFSSRMNQLSADIDSAELGQLITIEGGLADLKTQMDSSSRDRYGTFLASSPLFIILLILIVLLIGYAVMRKFGIGWKR